MRKEENHASGAIEQIGKVEQPKLIMKKDKREPHSDMLIVHFVED